MSFLNKIFGDPNQKALDKIQLFANEINKLEVRFEKFSDEELKEKTQEFKKQFQEGHSLDELLPSAFALAREASKRTLKQRHFDVQLLGGIILHQGQIAEMKTGEGKTLCATLPVYLNGLTGKGVHVVTVNDYLAKRDTVWMGQIYNFLGLSVGCIQHESSFIYDPLYREDKENTEFFKVKEDYLKPVERKEAYSADITYGTNNEFGFDYLRDNMAISPEQMVQRPLYYAIVDEVDSILIDEARTPLIISAPDEDSTDVYYKFADLVKHLREGEDYNVDEKMKAATFTDKGQDKIAQWLKTDPWKNFDSRVIYHLEAALKAQTLFSLDKDYVLREGEIIIVDEFTGRLMHGRRYSEGLHQAIEAKEGVKIQKESKTIATITFQNYFRLYEKLSGMTGTALTEAEEFSKIYNLEVTVIPTHKPMIRQDLSDRVYKNEKGKFEAVIKEIKERHEKEQPVLVGTISIERNEILSELLEKEGIPHQILNAKHHQREAEIIAQAGKTGAVTIATNMAGRGVDIVLGGYPYSLEEQKKVIDLGGLHIIGTERHESRRIDNQLRGRSGRQGDPGSSQFYISMEDDLMRIFGSERVKGLMEALKMPDDMPIENKLVSRSIEAAQKKVEGNNFDIRKHLVEYDDVLNKHREAIYRKRREIMGLNGKEKNSKEFLLESVEKEIEQVVLFHTANEDKKRWNIEEIYETANTIFPVPHDLRVKMDDLKEKAGDKMGIAFARTKIIEYLIQLARQAYDRLEKEIQEKLGEAGEPMRQIEKTVILRAIDTLWMEHLDAIDHLRTGIGLRGYGQRDPLVEYKKEAYRMFNELLHLIDKQVVYSIYKIGIATQAGASFREHAKVKFNVSEDGRQFKSSSSENAVSHKLRDEQGEKVGRNDPCPCGSGKKYKKCHGA